jgi:hypothetical protein
MIPSGLNDAERARLEAAGFDAALTAAIGDEAATMRFLWLRRSGFNAITGVAGATGAAFVANLFADDFGPLGVWLPILLPLGAAALSLATWWEIRRIKPVSRTRWAARKLAALTAAADPDDEDDDAWVELQKLAEAGAGAASAQDALRRIADALEDDDLDEAVTVVLGGRVADGQPGADAVQNPGAAPTQPPRRNPAPSRMSPVPARSLTPDQRDRLFDAIRTGVVIAALIALLILLLLRRQLGA